MTIRLLFFLPPEYLFLFSWGHSTFMCPGFLHSKKMISLLSSLYFFLNRVSFLLEEWWNFSFFFIIYLNFLDIKVTSSFVDHSELSDPSDSVICNLRALDKLFFSFLLEIVSSYLRVRKSFFCRWSMFWRWTSWTLRIPNNSSHARLFKSLASLMPMVLGSYTLGKCPSLPGLFGF